MVVVGQLPEVGLQEQTHFPTVESSSLQIPAPACNYFANFVKIHELELLMITDIPVRS